MQTYSVAVLAFALALAGCSEKNESDKAGVAGSVVSSEAPVRLERSLPAAFTGLPSETGGRCAVDIVNRPLTAESIVIKRAEGFRIYGWALDDKNGVVPRIAVLHLVREANDYYAPLTRRSDRDDLSKALGNPEFKNAGFGAVVDIAALPVGKYDVLIVQKGDRISTSCPTKLSITVVD